jgi:hypothetical protein
MTFPILKSRTSQLGRHLAVASALAALVVALGGAPPASAAATKVDCAVDPSALQPALDGARLGATLLVSGTCRGSFSIDGNSLTVKGTTGATLDASGSADRTLSISTGNVQLIGLTITGGSVSGGGGGGLLVDHATVSLARSIVTGNSATEVANAATGGAGVENYYGTLSIKNTTISNNVASGSGLSAITGGGILNFGDLTMDHSTIGANTAQLGGGIYNAGDLTMTRSVVSGNQAVDNGSMTSHGGGIFSESGTTSVSTSTISDNSSDFGGGLATAADTTITMSTISGNDATFDGAGVNVEGPSLSIIMSTVGGNSAGRSAGGIFNGTSGDGDLKLAGNIVGENTAGSASDCSSPYVAIRSEGYNLIGNANGCNVAAGPGDLIGSLSAGGVVDPKLGILTPRGGPTETMAPAPSSPAVNMIPIGAISADDLVTLCPSTGTDQRAKPRPQGTGCDAGSYETRF